MLGRGCIFPIGYISVNSRAACCLLRGDRAKGTVQPQTYIVRIYARTLDQGLAGTVEIVRVRETVSFNNFEQLRAVLEGCPRGARRKASSRKSKR